MITDSMTKYEVMTSLRKEFDSEVLPYYHKVILPQLKSELYTRCQREQRTVNLGWIDKITSNLSKFRILKRGNVEGDLPLFVCEFRWQNKQCYGNFFPEGAVVVYQAHCLQRYAERVLRTKKEIGQIFYGQIVKNQNSAFNIALSTPTHQNSHYFGLANALFLGDFDIEHPKSRHLWCNTCISYNEARYSQSRIMKSLHEMQSFVEKVRCDYSRQENDAKLHEYIKKNQGSPENIAQLCKFLTQKYLLWKLHLSLNLSFTEFFIAEIRSAVIYIENELKQFGINPNELSPYSKSHGIAWKGEIDYKG